MGKNDKLLLKIKSSIIQECPSAEIILYGSRARGEATSLSDWDILILVENNDKITESEDRFRNNLYELELETGQIISTLVYSKEYWIKKLKYSPLYINVNKEGIHL